MKLTLSLIKADIGSIGGHTQPSMEVLEAVKRYVKKKGRRLIDHYIGFTGDDIHILMAHKRGKLDPKIHKLAWNAFMAGTKIAKKQGLYGAGQDLLVSSFSGNVKGMGPGVAELEFEERENEPFLAFTMDKTEPGAFNLPLYLAFSDPMHNAGLILSSEIAKGFKFIILDAEYTKADRIIELNTPEQIYDIATLLRDNERFVIESIHSRATKEECASATTTRLHNIAGKYVGKDDPAALVRVQKQFPATGEILSPFANPNFVGGFMRGSHIGPLMPMKRNSPVNEFFDGPPMVSCLSFSVHKGILTEPVDIFAAPFWDYVRTEASRRAISIRRQGFSGPAMLPFSELEYTGIMENMKRLDKQFKVRKQTKK